MWFDSHCHLFDCEGPVEAVLERARAGGVREILVAGTDLETSGRALNLARHDGVYAAVGVHPNSSAAWEDREVARVEELLVREAAVAVGESGLDFYRDHSPPERQHRAFAAHIGLAKRYDKALIIHTRDSVDAAIESLEHYGPPARLVFHCWSGDAMQLKTALALGAFISFAGNVTFKNAGALRAVVPLVPEDRLLVETDSPYLAPEPKRGRANEPAFVSYVGRAIAAERDASADRIAISTARNARELFGVRNG